MNIKLQNCLKELENFQKINDELKLASEQTLSIANLTKQKNLAQDLVQSKYNIISSLQYSSVENEEDLEGLRTIITGLGELSDSEKGELAQSLQVLTADKFQKEIKDIQNSLISGNKRAIKHLGISTDLILQELHSEHRSGEASEILKNVFGQYYKIRELLKENDNNDDGKAFVKMVERDKQISKEYKTAIKKVYNDYKIEKNLGILQGKDILTLIGGMTVSLPGVALMLTGEVAGGIIKVVGKGIKLVTDLAAFPFAKLSQFISEKSDSKFAQATSYVALAPAYLFKGIGLAIQGVLKIPEVLIRGTMAISSMPFVYIGDKIVRSIKSNEIVYNEENSKKITKNLKQALKQKIGDIKIKKIIIFLSEAKEDTFSLYGICEDKDMVRTFSVSYEIDEPEFLKLKSIKKDKMTLQTRPMEDDQEFENALKIKESLMAERALLAHITSQEPKKVEVLEEFIINLSDKRKKSQDELEF